MKTDQNHPLTGDDPEVERLLQAAGPRLQPPAEAMAEVRAAVATEWRASVQGRGARAARSRGPWLAAAASVAAVGAVAWLLAPRLQGPADIGTVARVDGGAEVRHGDDGPWRQLGAAAVLRTGDEVRTSASGRLAVRRPDGLELRLDAGTALALNDAHEARLDGGRVYVDSGIDGARGDALVIATPLGRIRHLGTQYSVALGRERIEVRVREGSVAIDGRGLPVIARAGEALSLGRDQLERTAIESHGAGWTWAESMAPEFAIEGRSLDEFLGWVARETGRQLVYSSPGAARAAESTELKGSVSGLAPEAAVAAVLATKPALAYRFAGAQLRIDLARD
ncbi:MAG: FecR domain-containing protein [Steroidobacteraceae bacterium]